MKILDWLRHKRFPYEPLIALEISKDAILANLKAFSSLTSEKGIAPVLKANAYGHGLIEVARILDASGENMPFFIIDSYFEAIALRTRGIKKPLLVIGYTRPETIMSSRLQNVSFAITSIDTLRSISSIKREIKIHLKIDTGMHRQGIRVEEISDAIALIKSNQNICLDGICTHFSDADNKDTSFTLSQISLWNECVVKIKKEFPNLSYTHAAATDGNIFNEKISANVSRLGIGLYGLTENMRLNEKISLHPALQMKSIVTSVKILKRGETTGYGNTFRAERDMTIGLVPVGYSEGLDRKLSNAGAILVGNDRVVCPIIGRVSMNMTTIDLSAVKNPAIGTDVIVISDRVTDPNSIRAIAKICGTITYEIAVKIPAQLKRVVV